jgi:acyl dehydratase
MSTSRPRPTTAATEEPATVSDWVRVTQEMIDEFGHCTLDPDPMHVDPEWAAAGPFGMTISFGFLTISLLSRLMRAALKTPHARDLSVSGYYLNYGFERLRLVSPVKVNSRIRGHFQVIGREQDEKGRVLSTFHCVIEIEGEERPAMVADWLSLWVPPAVALQA